MSDATIALIKHFDYKSELLQKLVPQVCELQSLHRELVQTRENF
uniref:Uncharacterized protein n=1 Tax=Arundo donax TaxID=35708 RepID=A0A0A9B0L3_ARUDO